MSYDEWDAQQDAAADAMYEYFSQDPNTRAMFYEELYDEIVADFTAARLRSFYENEPEVASVALRALAESRVLRDQHETAAFLFAAIAAEVGLRSTY